MPRIKPSKHYKVRQKDGQRIREAMKPSEVKAFIMKVNNWTATEYRKKYDIFKNKLRAFEAVQEAGGYKVKKQSVVDILYYEAQAKYNYGKKYRPSQAMEKVKAMSAYSITKGRKKAQEAKFIRRQYEKLIKTDFGTKGSNDGLIHWAENSNTKLARKIMQLINEGTDPVKVHQGLAAMATQLEKEQRRMVKESPGETIGSDAAAEMDFDISPYLD